VNRNTSAALLVAIVTVAAVGLAFGAGGVAGQEGSGELVNGTVDVTNDTESIYVDIVAVDDYNGSTAPDVTVTAIGVQPDQDVANGTELYTETRTVASSTTESYDYAFNDAERDSYDRIAITVEWNGDRSLIDSTDWGSLVATTGGGGGGLGSGTSTAALAVVLALVAFVTMRD